MTWLILVLSAVLICATLSRRFGGSGADLDYVGLRHITAEAGLSNAIAKDGKIGKEAEE